MIHACVFLVAIAGSLLLALGMPRHQQEWCHQRLTVSTSRILRCLGFSAITGSLVTAKTGFGWGYGTVEWLGWLTVAIAIVAMTNAGRGKFIRKSKP